jgi:hypothetical protein
MATSVEQVVVEQGEQGVIQLAQVEEQIQPDRVVQVEFHVLQELTSSTQVVEVVLLIFLTGQEESVEVELELPME